MSINSLGPNMWLRSLTSEYTSLNIALQRLIKRGLKLQSYHLILSLTIFCNEVEILFHVWSNLSIVLFYFVLYFNPLHHCCIMMFQAKPNSKDFANVWNLSAHAFWRPKCSPNHTGKNGWPLTLFCLSNCIFPIKEVK